MTRQPVQLVLLGPPGARRGAQAARLARRLGLTLFDDQLVSELVRERVKALSPGQGFIFDGYPRTAAEAQSLQKVLAGRHRLRRPLLVVWLQASADRDSARALRAALVGWTDVIEVDGEQPPSSIAEEIIRALRHHAAAWTSPPGARVGRA